MSIGIENLPILVSMHFIMIITFYLQRTIAKRYVKTWRVSLARENEAVGSWGT